MKQLNLFPYLMPKVRVCRHCRLEKYLTPSKYPGCCSQECFEARKAKRLYVRGDQK